MRRLERGASYVPLIIVIVLLVVAVVWAWVKHDESDQLKKQVATLQAQVDQQEAQRIFLASYLRDVFRQVGFPINNPTETKKADLGVDADAVNAFTQEKLSGPTSLTEKFVGKFPTSAYTVTDEGGIQVDPQDPTKIGYINPAEVPSEATLEQLFALMLKGMDRMLFDINRLVVQLQAEKNGRASDNQAKQDSIDAKDGEISGLRDELAQEKSRAASNERSLRDEINGLQGRVREAEDALETAQREARDQLAKMNQELLAANQKVRTLKDRKKPETIRPGPDGQILSASEGSGLVVLDRGKDNRMMPGLTFLVYAYGKGNQRIDKGRVQVLDVTSSTATARVMEVLNPLNPIVRGDMFESPLYNPNEVLNFYLLGNFRKYGHSDAATRLRSLGAAVDSKVTIDTDFLVMGAPANEEENLRDDDAYKHAVELGVPVITEAQLSLFMNY